jgi:hypothetical protein
MGKINISCKQMKHGEDRCLYLTKNDRVQIYILSIFSHKGENS